MKLSGLQKYILRKVYLSGKARISRLGLVDYYRQRKSAPPLGRRVKIVTQSLERLIDKGLLIGYGHRTQEKFFIREIKLTAVGRRLAKSLLGKQRMLPFRRRIRK